MPPTGRAATPGLGPAPRLKGVRLNARAAFGLLGLPAHSTGRLAHQVVRGIVIACPCSLSYKAVQALNAR